MAQGGPCCPATFGSALGGWLGLLVVVLLRGVTGGLGLRIGAIDHLGLEGLGQLVLHRLHLGRRQVVGEDLYADPPVVLVDRDDDRDVLAGMGDGELEAGHGA